MNQPRLYERYDRHDAVALFGSEAEARSLCDGQWVVFPDVVLCLATLGEPPRLSHFPNGGEFCWVADKPYQVGEDPNIGFVPKGVIQGHARTPIQLFVRYIGLGRYLYVGRLAPACRFTLTGLGNHGEAYFGLSPALASEVWTGMGGLKSGDIDHSAVDAALQHLRHPVTVLEHLRHPVTVEERLGVLRQLVAYWHGPIRPEDGFGETDLEGLAIPYPLRWWYRWAGRRRNILSGQNTLLGPCDLLVRDDLLVFYGENQWCYEWGTPFDGDDPPVFGRSEATDPWEPEGITLSEHLTLACLFEGVMTHSPYGASNSWLGGDILDMIIEHVPPVAINPWRWGGSSRFYAKGGAFMFTMPNGEIDGIQGCSVWVGAKTEHPLRFLKPFIDEGWEYAAV